jgi:AcrR family transcriptional regulator
MDHNRPADSGGMMASGAPVGQKQRMVDRRVQRTKSHLAGAVIALAGEKDFAALTIAEIADRAGVGYATFFRHYRDKDELLAEVADTLIDDLIALMVPAILRDDTLAASVALCRYVDENRAICKSLLAGGAEAKVHRQLAARAAERAAGVALPGGPRDVPPELVIGHAVNATMGLISAWLDLGTVLGVEAMGAVIDALVMRPIRAPTLSGKT